MDSFEPIRAAAERLHLDVIGGADTPTRPMELVQAALAHLKLDLIWLPTGDPALKGARAVLDDQSGTIFAEDIGSSAERALIVAHEIGHECIHAGSVACSAEDVDPSRSMEAAPVGLQRVEEYGAQERRELQANVFARAFLFPRSLARQMFVEKALTASDIAKQLDLPVPLVRQQILDVVLLPPSPADRRSPKVLSPARYGQTRHRIARLHIAARPFSSRPVRERAKRRR